MFKIVDGRLHSGVLTAHGSKGFTLFAVSISLAEVALLGQNVVNKQRFPLTFKLAGPAANLGVRHGSVVVGAHWGHSNTIQAAAWLVKLR